MKKAKLIIAGGRDFNDYSQLTYVSDWQISEIKSKYPECDIEIISGGCRGADALGERYANEHGYKLTVMPANWKKHGKAAGYIRNTAMADYVSKDIDVFGMLIAFWDGKSRGTSNMIDIARKKGLAVNVQPYI